MVKLHLILDGSGKWKDLLDKKQMIHLGDQAAGITVAALDHGMKSGRPSVCIRIDLLDGKVVLAETSLHLFAKAAEILKIKYREQF